MYHWLSRMWPRFAAQAVADGIITLIELSEPLEGGAHYPLFLLCLQQLHKLVDRDWLARTFNDSKIELMTMLPGQYHSIIIFSPGYLQVPFLFKNINHHKKKIPPFFSHCLHLSDNSPWLISAPIITYNCKLSPWLPSYHSPTPKCHTAGHYHPMTLLSLTLSSCHSMGQYYHWISLIITYRMWP